MTTESKIVAEQVAETFLLDVDFHVQDRLLENAPYRHVKWRANVNARHWFELISAPGMLTIRGDMGTYVFAGSEDMFTDPSFDTSPAGDVDARSWTQHLIATDSRQYGVDTHKYSIAVARNIINEAVEKYLDGTDDEELRWMVREDVLSHVDDEDDLRRAASMFRHGSLSFDDAWEWDLNSYSYTYLWCLHAIRWGINDYRDALRAYERNA